MSQKSYRLVGVELCMCSDICVLMYVPAVCTRKKGTSGGEGSRDQYEEETRYS